MKSFFRTFVNSLICLNFFVNTVPLLWGQDQVQNQQIKTGQETLLFPTAVPVASPEEAIIANYEAIKEIATKEREREILAEEQKRTAVLEKEDWKRLDFSKDAVKYLLLLTPLLIIFHFMFRKRICFHIGKKRLQKRQEIRFTYWPLLFLIPILFAQWITVYTINSKTCYESFFYEQKTISCVDQLDAVGKGLCQVKIKDGLIRDPMVIVDGCTFQEVSLPELKNIILQSDSAPLCFAQSNGTIILPLLYAEKDIHVYSPRKILKPFLLLCEIRNCIATALFVILFWVFIQMCINNGINCCYKKKFREKVLFVGLTSFSVVVAGAFWMSHIPLVIVPDGKQYIDYACSNTIIRCLYATRTPGYPLFLSFVDCFSPLSFHSLIYFQTLIFLLSLSWLLYELYKKGIPMLFLLIAYALFYNYMAKFFFEVLCETLEISGIAATIAIGLRLSEYAVKRRTMRFISVLFLAVLLVFCSVMIKPFPGLIVLPGGMMFLGLLGTIKLRKNILLTVLVGILSVIPPAAYCTLRWKLCGDWNFCSVINTLTGGYQLTISTPQSINAEKIRTEQRDLAEKIIQRVLTKRPDIGDWPWCDNETTLSEVYALRNVIMGRDGIFGYFEDVWNNLDKEQQESFKRYAVFRNAQCKAFLNVGDPQLHNNMMKQYWNKVYQLYSDNPRWISDTQKLYNPYQTSRYFHLTVSLPLFVFLFILFVPFCKKIRYGSWKIIVIIIGVSTIPLFTYLGQNLWLSFPIFEARSEMVMFFSTMLGTILLSMYCIYSCIISFILTLRLLYLRCIPEQAKHIPTFLKRKSLFLSKI